MGGLLYVLFVFLIIGCVLQFAFTMIRFSFKLVFWILGLIFGILGWVLGFGFFMLLGILVIFVPILLIMKKR
ncbi:MAG: hypothetical protein FWG94_02220 [Oscillospiraceae bacterium]|nr:hypothetical protein [Oscillospiraceae bacterium]